MHGTEIRQLNAEDAAEYQAVFLGALQSAPTAFAADYAEESTRSSDQIAERFRREVIFGAFVDGRLCAIATFLQQTSPKRIVGWVVVFMSGYGHWALRGQFNDKRLRD